MSDSYDSMNEQTQKLEVALKFTNDDMENAKLMLSGKLNDIIVVKGKFLSPEKRESGAFLVFININQEYIAAIKSVISANDSIFTKLRVFDDWKSLNKNIVAYTDGEDETVFEEFSGIVLNELIGKDVFPDVKNKNLDYVATIMQDFIKDHFDDGNARCQIELEETNSMEVEVAGITIMNPAEDLQEESAEAESSLPEPATRVKSDFEKTIDEIEAKAQAIVEGKSVLSPVKGRFINEISAGDKLYVVLPGNDSISERIVDAYKARDNEGNAMPIVGRIVEMVPNEGQGYIIYLLVAKGIYAKIIEEENVKVQTEASSKKKKKGGDADSDDKEKKGLGILAYIIFVVVIIGLIVLLTMF